MAGKTCDSNYLNPLELRYRRKDVQTYAIHQVGLHARWIGHITSDPRFMQNAAASTFIYKCFLETNSSLSTNKPESSNIDYLDPQGPNIETLPSTVSVLWTLWDYTFGTRYQERTDFHTVDENPALP